MLSFDLTSYLSHKNNHTLHHFYDISIQLLMVMLIYRRNVVACVFMASTRENAQRLYPQSCPKMDTTGRR